MSSRGQKMINLIENERMRQLSLPSYESTKGVDLKTVNMERLKEVFGSGATNIKVSPVKPIAHVTPIKRITIKPTDSEFPAVRNLRFSLNEIPPELGTGSGRRNNNTNQRFTTEHNYNTRSFNNRSVIRGNALDDDSPPDPFEDSGSSYCPSVDSNYSTDGEHNEVNESSNASIISNSEMFVNRPVHFESMSVTLNNVNNGESQPPETGQEPEGAENGTEIHYMDEVELGVRPNIITVSETKKINGKRIRDKGHSCFFCQKIICNNFARHIEKHHANETEAAKILAMPKQSKRRRDAFANLIRYGDFLHNCDVLCIKAGELILARRPTAEEHKFSSYSDYGPCPECLGFLVKKKLWHHLKYNCPSKSAEKNEYEDKTSGKGPISESTAILNGILGNNLTKGFLETINQFRNDAISTRCKEDDTIMRYGAFLYEKYSTTQSELIRQSMRQLGRLTLEMKKLGEVFQNLSEVLVPEKFDLIVQATKAICRATREDPTKRPEFQTPSLALKIGYAVKKCASIERGQCLRRGDLRKNREYLAFLHLLNLEWAVRISSNALATLYSRKKNAEDLLPITDDLLKLNNFLDSKIKEAKENLSSLNYSKLASLTLARIIMFNKRRSGEASKMTLMDYSSRPNWKDVGTEELKQSLTPFENKIASALTIVKIFGKRGRIVPILLTKDVKESVDLIISKRVQYGILNENPYVFAISNTPASRMRGHDCLHKWCTEAELKSPELVTSTKLRKYVATVCQIFNLTENEHDWLARHLGHDIRVHREFYRLQENAVELTKVSRLLLAVDQGEAHKFAGKELKDINLQDFVEMEENEHEESLEKDSDEEEREEGKEQNDNIEDDILGDILVDDNKSKNTGTNKKNKKTSKSTRKCEKRPWSGEEKEIILKRFKPLVKRGALPGKEQCSQLMDEYKIFEGRKWTDLKFFIKNHLTKCKKTVNKT